MSTMNGMFITVAVTRGNDRKGLSMVMEIKKEDAGDLSSKELSIV